jgi:hypothetical protein
MKVKTGGDLTTKLTDYPLGIGLVCSGADSTFHSDDSMLLAEYYTYQAPGEPKFVLTPSDGKWYDNLLGEAEALWGNPRTADWSSGESPS